MIARTGIGAAEGEGGSLFERPRNHRCGQRAFRREEVAVCPAPFEAHALSSAVAQ